MSSERKRCLTQWKSKAKNTVLVACHTVTHIKCFTAHKYKIYQTYHSPALFTKMRFLLATLLGKWNRDQLVITLDEKKSIFVWLKPTRISCNSWKRFIRWRQRPSTASSSSNQAISHHDKNWKLTTNIETRGNQREDEFLARWIMSCTNIFKRKNTWKISKIFVECFKSHNATEIGYNYHWAHMSTEH